MSSDVDSTFYTALRLLHSRARSSAEQLKAMLDEALAQKLTTHASRSPTNIKQETKPSKSTFDVMSKVEKRVFEKVKLEPPEIQEPKKARVQSPQRSRSLSSSPEAQSKTQKPLLMLEDVKDAVKVELDSDATDIEEEDTDTGEFPLEMGLGCVVCKHMDTTPNNQTVECQECHNLYHQECHKPPITDKDISDPRVVWYCSKCTKSMKKLSNKAKGNNNKSPTTTSTAFATTVIAAREAAFQLMANAAKAESKMQSSPTLMQPFKRAEPKVSTSSTSAVGSSTKPAIGLAGFAAHLNRSNSSSSSLASVTSPGAISPLPSSTVAAPASNPLLAKTADKRLQQMKKKAAKGQEKKRFATK